MRSQTLVVRSTAVLRNISLAALASTIVLQGVLAALPSSTTVVHAQEEDRNEQTEAANNYQYVAERSNNLTLLVRRSIQLHTADNEDVSLSNAQVVYAETNIVQELGAGQIDVGQTVTVPNELVDKYVTSSQDLSQSQQNAWNRYAVLASFNLDHIQTVAQRENDQATENEATNANGDNGDADTDADDENDEDETADDNGTDWWWFLILAAAVAGLWYTVRRSDSTGNSSRSNTNTTVRSNSKSTKKKK